jgi:hypothetical protein
MSLRASATWYQRNCGCCHASNLPAAAVSLCCRQPNLILLQRPVQEVVALPRLR